MQHMDFKIVGGKEVICMEVSRCSKGKGKRKIPLHKRLPRRLLGFTLNKLRTCMYKSIKVMFTLHRITLRVHTKT